LGWRIKDVFYGEGGDGDEGEDGDKEDDDEKKTVMVESLEVGRGESYGRVK
jgi:hypothetical protein